jgi:eukaryotic-like serine/threonine-protein kinase
MSEQQIFRRADGVATWIDDRYRVERCLDQDELVEVWRARDELLNRLVVLKMLHQELLEQDVVLEQFQAEAMAIAAIAHTNVARRYEVEIRDDLAYTTSEYIEGPSLAELLATGPLEVDALAAVGFHAASGLAAVHGQGVVHRNIWPRTTVLGTDGRLRLAYFRMPRIPGVGVPDRARSDREAERFLAPEQVRGEVASPASDVFALGRTLHAAWTGSLDTSLETPTDGPLARTLRAIPGLGNDERPERLREIIIAATQPRPEARPTASEVRDRLADICGTRGELVLRPLVAART